MNVALLRAALASLPDDMPVILASDEEGNGFHKLSDAEESAYREGWSVEVVHPDDEQGDELRALVLWP